MNIKQLHKVGALFLVALLSVTSCSKSQEKNKPNDSYSVAVIETSSQTLKTNFSFFDSELKQTEKTAFPYGSVGSYGYSTPCVRDGVMYEMSVGTKDKKDYGTVLAYELDTGKVTEYKFGRVNLTDFIVTGSYIYALSNLNHTTYIDRIALYTKDIDTYELKGKIAMDFVAYEDYLYVLADESSSYNMYKVNITTQTAEKVQDLSKWYLGKADPTYLVQYEDNIYMPCKDKLLRYSTKEDAIQEIPLYVTNAWGLYLEDDKLYVSCVDVFTPGSESDILEFDLAKQHITSKYHIGTSIMQFFVQDSSLYVLGDADLSIYKMEGDKQCTLVKKTEVKPSSREYSISAMFPYRKK